MERTILIVYGTRPEAIKLWPVATALRGRRRLRVRVAATGQHAEIASAARPLGGPGPDFRLSLMRRGEGLAGFAARGLRAIDALLARARPDAVLVQGDTTTAFLGALAAFYRGIPVAHVEAGLRTGDLSAPFPEELNRRLIGSLASWHFAPTLGAARNLRAEGAPPSRIFVTGNPVVDSLRRILPSARKRRFALARRWPEARGEYLLVTGHRRESFGAPLAEICSAVLDLSRGEGAIPALFPVHPNPEVRRTVRRILGRAPGVRLLPPLDYLDFIALLDGARLVLSDSGGVQEEAACLGVPILVLREKTERPEVIASGAGLLAGTRRDRIVAIARGLLRDPVRLRAMARPRRPFGDGRSGPRIARLLDQILGRIIHS